MITRTNNFKASENLSNAIALRAKQLGHSSQASYLKTLVRLDMRGELLDPQTLNSHRTLGAMSPERQDILDKNLLTKLQNL